MPAYQETLPLRELENERISYLRDQLITYIGNKRNLLEPIENALTTVQKRLGKTKLRTFDSFSGSGIVSRKLKKYSSELISNDIERYACVIAQCYLTNESNVQYERLRRSVHELNHEADRNPVLGGFIERLYAPADDDDIKPGERVFYTRDNARRLDTFASLIQEESPELRPLLLGPLLASASVHANTSGVFKGFYKNKNGVGKFGGSGSDALPRIKGRISLEEPVLSAFDAKCTATQLDANEAASYFTDLDLTYIDPPYNQHPYGSNYFMLNLLANYEEPEEISKVSGIPANWARSGFNVRKKSHDLLRDLVKQLDSKYLLVSFNDEGFIRPQEMLDMLGEVGRVTEYQTQYNTFRGSRNLKNRSIYVTEHLYLVEKAI